MGISFTLTDRELPASPAFIKFLSRMLEGGTHPPEPWVDQRSELLMPALTQLPQQLAADAERIMASARGREHIARAYQLLACLLCGALEPIEALQARFRFIAVVGMGRSGGSYLTAELYRALGMAPEQVPGDIAHDAFPDAGPFLLEAGGNSWLATLKSLAEYLVMTEVFFAGHAQQAGAVVVPKKLTQAAYAGGLYRQVFGPGLECVITLRHPAPACLSTCEKSGGLPPDGCFAVRSNMEAWCRRDLHGMGVNPGELARWDYFEAYLRHWEYYHLLLLTSGLLAIPRLCIVPYQADALQDLAGSFHARFGSGLRPGPFTVSARVRSLHPQWLDRAAPVVARVAATWRAAGFDFPYEALQAAW